MAFGSDDRDGSGTASGAAAASPPSGARSVSGRLPWQRLPSEIVPIKISGGRFWLWALALCVIAALMIVGAPSGGFIDFPQFWAAGRTVGSPDLLDPVRHAAWQEANGLRPGFFAYPPGTAWLYVPFSLLPLAAGFWLNAVAVVVLVAASGILGARIFGLDRRIGLVAAFAWAPCMASAALGQNAPLGLLLALLTIEGLRLDDDLLAGLGAGLLLYKPTLAAPLLGLMLLRRRWGALVVAGVLGAGWYVAAVAATAGDWSWPGHWLTGLGDYYSVDTAGNAGKALSAPGLLAGHGIPETLALAVGAALAAAAVPRLLRAPIVEAGAGACLVGLAVSPHSLNYEAAFVLPIVLWSVGSTGGLREPTRTRLICLAFLIAPVYVVSSTVGATPLALVTLAGSVIWISGWQCLKTAAPHLAGTAVPRKMPGEAAARG